VITALIIIFVLCLLISSAGFVFVSHGCFKALRQRTRINDLQPVTVIVAAHNEAHNIGTLFDSLNKQKYPFELLHVLLVDDRSTDGSTEVARSAAGDLSLDIIRIEDTPDAVSPKKFALHTGIQHASTELLLFTDADCRPSQGWVRSMVATLRDDADVVVGCAPLRPTHTRASRYAAYESYRTAAFMIAATAQSLPYMATGRNWAYKKSTYVAGPGLPASYSILGGDDDLLMQQFVRDGAVVRCCCDHDALVWSDAAQDMRHLVRQKLRHYSVSNNYRGTASVLLALHTGAQVAAVLLAMLSVAACCTGRTELLLPAVGVVWMCWFNSAFLRPLFKHFKVEMSRWSMTGFEFMHIIFSTLIGITSFVKPPRW